MTKKQGHEVLPTNLPSLSSLFHSFSILRFQCHVVEDLKVFSCVNHPGVVFGVKTMYDSCDRTPRVAEVQCQKTWNTDSVLKQSTTQPLVLK